MKTKLSFYTFALLCPLLWVGCAASGPVVVDGPKVTTMGPDIQDFANVADFMYQSMFDSDAFANSPHKPAILAVGTIRNDTQCQLDTNLLEKKIRVALLNSGKVRKDITNGAINDADFTLSGKIIVTHARQGEIRQQTYTFQLSLSNPQGIAVWEDEKEVTKQSKRPSNGF